MPEDTLAITANRRREADDAAARAATDLRRMVRIEREAGVTVTELAARTGYSRETIRKMLMD